MSEQTGIASNFAMNELLPELALVVQQVLDELPDEEYQLEIMLRQWRQLCHFFVGDRTEVNAVEQVYLRDAFRLVCYLYKYLAARVNTNGDTDTTGTDYENCLSQFVKRSARLVPVPASAAQTQPSPRTWFAHCLELWTVLQFANFIQGSDSSREETEYEKDRTQWQALGGRQLPSADEVKAVAPTFEQIKNSYAPTLLKVQR